MSLLVVAPRRVLIALVVMLAVALPAQALARPKAGTAIVPPSTMLDERALSASGASEVLVALRRGTGGEPLVRQVGGTLVSKDLALWRVRSGVARGLVGALLARDSLRYAEPDRAVVRLHRAARHIPGDPLTMNFQQELALIGATQAEPPGPGVPVSILDTGVDATHPEFANRPNTTYLNTQSLGNGPLDTESHGTAVASVAAAPINGVGMVGVYPDAQLRIVDIGTGAYGDCSVLIAALDLARQTAPRGVVNISAGYPINDAGCFAFYEAVQVAFGGGTIVVASAGNEREEGSPEEAPANLNHVLTIAATRLSEEPAGFSNATLGVDLTAPGEEILVAVPTSFDEFGYSIDYGFGTSFSAPMVAAATAWVWTVRTNLDHTQIFNLMRFSARDIWRQGWDPDTGFGMLDIPRALSATPPIRDQQEPNDDLDQVKAGGLFRTARTPLTNPSKRSNRLRAMLDYTEDPADVYRVWVPTRSSVRIVLTPNADVDLEVFARTAKTIYYKNRRLELRTGRLIAFSDATGTKAETIRLVNDSRGEYVYVAAYLPKDGPLDATYTLKVTAGRR